MAHDSAQPCGCDPGANYLCEDHRLIRDAIRDTYTNLAMAVPQPPRMAQAAIGLFNPSQEAQDAMQRAMSTPLYPNCQTCDGYAINASEAPYCPSCARERETQAAAYKLAKERDTIGPIRETWTPERPQIAVLGRERRQDELDKALATLKAQEQRDAMNLKAGIAHLEGQLAEMSPAGPFPFNPPTTRYMLRLKLKVTGDVSEHSFDSMTARNLFIFTLGPWADVQEEWTA